MLIILTDEMINLIALEIFSKLSIVFPLLLWFIKFKFLYNTKVLENVISKNPAFLLHILGKLGQSIFY